MLLLRVTVILIACWIVKCDLLDLYVQHMDEAMRTKWYRKDHVDSVPRRIKRSPEHGMPRFKLPQAESRKTDWPPIERPRYKLPQHKIPFDSMETQRSDESWSRQMEENYSNKREDDPEEEHESGEESGAESTSVNAIDETEAKTSPDAREREKNKIHILHRYSGSRENHESADEPLEVDEWKPSPVEDLTDVKETENDKLPLFETIKENRDLPAKFKKYRPLSNGGLLYKRIKRCRPNRPVTKPFVGRRSRFNNRWRNSEIRRNHDVRKFSYTVLKNPGKKFENRSRIAKIRMPFINGGENVRLPQTPRAIKREEEPELILMQDSKGGLNEMIDDEDSPFEIIREHERQHSIRADPSLKRTPKSSERQAPKKYSPMSDTSVESAENAKGAETRNARPRRSAPNCRFSRCEKLDDDGDIVLEWDPSDDEEVTFRVTGKTAGYVGVGFNDKSNMKGADILLIWVDDHTGVANVLDMHGVKEMNAAPHTDTFQDVRVLGGSQNDTHTTAIFVRKWQTCDPQDYPLSGDTVRVIWAMHHTDPELNTAAWHERKRGGRALRLKTAAAYSPPEAPTALHWDVKLNPFNITGDEHTIYWCKIFTMPNSLSETQEKYHMIGYAPLVEKANEDLVHHMILYECSTTNSILGNHSKLAGANCYSSVLPKEWDTCLQPVLTWVRGSKGEWLPEHVGIPIGERQNNSFYMLEVHYNNPGMRKVIDQSGVRLYLSRRLRPNEAGILLTGMAVSPLHLVPPQQKEYATVGYCTPHCTSATLPEEGINVVSVVLHSHLAGRRLSLKHIRQGKELPRIVQDNHFDFDYQQSHVMEKEVKVLPGDELVAECVYGTVNRRKPTLGGYAASEEMCLAFVMYYPRTHLASCYSMTPVEDLFRTLGVISLKGLTMEAVKKLFFEDDWIPSSMNHISPSSISEKETTAFKEAQSVLRAMRNYTTRNKNESNVFAQLVIENPEEFRGRTMAEHMITMPWTDDLLAKAIENSIYHGKHMTFCRRKDDEFVLSPTILNFPNYTALPEANDTTCSELRVVSATSRVPHSLVIILVDIFIVLAFTI